MGNDKIENLRRELATKPLPEKELTVRKTILALMPEILALRAKPGGTTYTQLAAWFAEKGVATTPTAICKYVCEHNKKAGSVQPTKVEVPATIQEKPVFINPLRKDPERSGNDFLAIPKNL